MFPVTKDSAIHVAKWLVQNRAKAVGGFKGIAMNAAVDNGSVEEIFDMVYAMGFFICADESSPQVQGLIQQRAIIKDETRK